MEKMIKKYNKNVLKFDAMIMAMQDKVALLSSMERDTAQKKRTFTLAKRVLKEKINARARYVSEFKFLNVKITADSWVEDQAVRKPISSSMGRSQSIKLSQMAAAQ